MSSFPSSEGRSPPTPTTITRLKKDYDRLQKEPIPGLIALPNEANILEWHYCLTGANGTDYQGGHYWGKVLFPPEYPFKPPAICMITPSGRYQTNVRICLSISDYHPESWNPAWGISSILLGLQVFMNCEEGSVGTTTATSGQRRQYTTDSKSFNLKEPQFRAMFPQLVQEWSK